MNNMDIGNCCEANWVLAVRSLAAELCAARLWLLFWRVKHSDWQHRDVAWCIVLYTFNWRSGTFAKLWIFSILYIRPKLCPTITLHPQLTFYCKFDLNLDLLLSSCGRLILNQYLMKSLCVLSTLNLSKLNIFLLPNCCRITKNLHWCANNHDWWLYEEDPRLNKTYYR